MAPRTKEKELKYLETVMEDRPDSLLFARLADAYRKEGDIVRAIELCINGLNFYPYYTTGRILLGRCYLEQQKYQEAIEAFRTVCMADRRNQVAIKMLADIFAQQGNEEKAADLYSLLYTMDPSNASLSHLCSQFAATSGKIDIYEILGMQSVSGRVEPAAEGLQHEAPVEITEMSPDGEAYAEIPRDAGVSDQVLPADDGVADGATDAATEVTGSDVSNRMSMMFDEKAPPVETAARDESVPTAESDTTAAVEEVTAADVGADETPDVSSADVSGNDVSDRIEELFSEEEKPVTEDTAAPDASTEKPGIDEQEEQIADQEFDLSGISVESSSSEENAVEEAMEKPFSDPATEEKDTAYKETASDEGEDVSGADVSDRIEELFSEQHAAPSEAEEVRETPSVSEPVSESADMAGDSEGPAFEPADSSDMLIGRPAGLTDASEDLAFDTDGEGADFSGEPFVLSGDVSFEEKEDTGFPPEGTGREDELLTETLDLSPETIQPETGERKAAGLPADVADTLFDESIPESAEVTPELPELSIDAATEDATASPEIIDLEIKGSDSQPEMEASREDDVSEDSIPSQELAGTFDEQDEFPAETIDLGSEIESMTDSAAAEAAADRAIDLPVPETGMASDGIPDIEDISVDAESQFFKDSDRLKTFELSDKQEDNLTEASEVDKNEMPEPLPVLDDEQRETGSEVQEGPSGEDISDRISDYFGTSDGSGSDTGLPDVGKEEGIPADTTDGQAAESVEEEADGGYSEVMDAAVPEMPGGIISEDYFFTAESEEVTRIDNETISEKDENDFKQADDVMQMFDGESVSTVEDAAAESLSEEDGATPEFAETMQFDSALFEEMLNPSSEDVPFTGEEGEDTATVDDATFIESSEGDMEAEEIELVSTERDGLEDTRDRSSALLDAPVSEHADEYDLKEIAGLSETSDEESLFEVTTEQLTEDNNRHTAAPQSDELVLDSTATFEVTVDSDDHDDHKEDMPLVVESGETLTDLELETVDGDDETPPSGNDVAGKIGTMFPEDGQDSSPVNQIENGDIESELLIEDAIEIETIENKDNEDAAFIETMAMSRDEMESASEKSGDDASLGAKHVEADDSTSIHPDGAENVDGPPGISGSDVKDRLDDFFPAQDLMSLSAENSSLVEDEKEEAADQVSEFYTLSGDDAASGSAEEVPEQIGDVEFSIPPLSDMDEGTDSDSSSGEEEESVEKTSSFAGTDLLPDVELFEEPEEGKESEMAESAEYEETIILDERDKPFDIPDDVITPTLADIYFQQGLIRLSLQMYNRLLERDPGNDKIAERIAEIRSVLEGGEGSEQKLPAKARGDITGDNKREMTDDESSAGRPRERRKTASNKVADDRPLAGVRIKKRYKQKIKNARKSKK